MTPFHGRGDTVDVVLDTVEADLLRRVPLLLARIGSGESDAASERLNPSAYRDDGAADREYRRLMAGDLDRARADDRDLFLETVREGETSLTVAQAEAWLRVIGDARLALAAGRGVVEGEDDWEHRIGSDPDLAMVAWLGYLQAMLVAALG